LIFGELKEKALIYILTEAIHFPFLWRVDIWGYKEELGMTWIILEQVSHDESVV
jgi:hypothetical protein